jgi:hypothetical protein
VDITSFLNLFILFFKFRNETDTGERLCGRSLNYPDPDLYVFRFIVAGGYLYKVTLSVLNSKKRNL